MIREQWKGRPIVCVCSNVKEIGKYNLKTIKNLYWCHFGENPVAFTGHETCRSLQNQKKWAYGTYVALILFCIIPIVFVYKTIL